MPSDDKPPSQASGGTSNELQQVHEELTRLRAELAETQARLSALDPRTVPPAPPTPTSAQTPPPGAAAGLNAEPTSALPADFVLHQAPQAEPTVDAPVGLAAQSVDTPKTATRPGSPPPIPSRTPSTPPPPHGHTTPTPTNRRRFLALAGALAGAGALSGWAIFRLTTPPRFGGPLTGHTGSVFSVAWSPDGTQLATASSDRTARIWNTQTGNTLHTLTGHTNWVNSVTWSPDGTQLATASNDKTARIWNLDDL